MLITPSKSLFFFCISFVMGVALQSFVVIPEVIIWGIIVLAAAGIAASFFTKPWLLRTTGFCLLLLVIGISRLQISQYAVMGDTVSRFNDSPEKLTLIGQLIDASDIRETSQKLSVRVDGTKSVVLVTAGRYPEYEYLDRIELIGKLKTPEVTEEFNYKNYLMKDGIYSIMDFPTIKLLSHESPSTPGQWLYAKILSIKRALRQSIYLQFPPPESAIVEGIMLGGTTNMPKELKDKFSATGLNHLTAVSGSNVLILSNILMVVLLGMGLWRSQAFYGSVFFIWLYIAIAAFPASGIRAGIMATVFLLAQKLGRQNTTSRLIVLTATVMLFCNPFLLRYDVGFQLSFLASMGIIYLKPFFDRLFSFFEKNQASYFLGIVSVTLSAQIFTLPVVAYYFKNMSLVAPITNLLVIPIIDFIMIFGFLAAVVGMGSSFLGLVFSMPAWILLRYFMVVMDIFYGPWAAVPFEHVPLIWLAVYYIAAACLIKYASRWLKPGFLGY